MALTSPQISAVDALVFEGKTVEAETYLVSEGYSKAYAQTAVAFFQQIDLSKIVRGTFADRALILKPYDGLRFIVISDGLNDDDYEGMEFIYSNGSWKNAAGYVE